ncbi:MAG: hypothetical protein DCC75_07765 [Proteobacteria bacterium]|nr:MAG: hypothetical protein DCC75_07765 [Pseudomonadota bacterium]
MIRAISTMLIVLLVLISCASAQELCVKNRIKVPKNGRINFKKVISVAEACARNQTKLLNTAVLVGNIGLQGEPGPLVQTLPSGATLRGEFRVGAQSPDKAHGFISFPFPLETTPTIVWVPQEQSSNPNCPGSAADPEAAPGFFCLYTPPAYTSNWTTIEFGSGSSQNITRFGFRLKITGSGDFYFGGGWAVTAP